MTFIAVKMPIHAKWTFNHCVGMVLLYEDLVPAAVTIRMNDHKRCYMRSGLFGHANGSRISEVLMSAW